MWQRLQKLCKWTVHFVVLNIGREGPLRPSDPSLIFFSCFSHFRDLYFLHFCRFLKRVDSFRLCEGIETDLSVFPTRPRLSLSELASRYILEPWKGTTVLRSRNCVYDANQVWPPVQFFPFVFWIASPHHWRNQYSFGKDTTCSYNQFSKVKYRVWHPGVFPVLANTINI